MDKGTAIHNVCANAKSSIKDLILRIDLPPFIAYMQVVGIALSAIAEAQAIAAITAEEIRKFKSRKVEGQSNDIQ